MKFSYRSAILDKAREHKPLQRQVDASQLKSNQNILGAIAGRFNLQVNHLGIRKHNRVENGSDNKQQGYNNLQLNYQQNNENQHNVPLSQGFLDILRTTKSPTTAATPHLTKRPVAGLSSEIFEATTTVNDAHLSQGFLDILRTTDSPTTAKSHITKRPPIVGLPSEMVDATVKPIVINKLPISGLPSEVHDGTDDVPILSQGFLDILGTTTTKSIVTKRPPIVGLPSAEDDAPKNCTVPVIDPTVTKKPAIPGLPSEEEDICGEFGVGNRIDQNALKSLLG